MPGTVSPHVEMTCHQGLADLEKLEGPWLDCMGAGKPESTAIDRCTPLTVYDFEELCRIDIFLKLMASVAIATNAIMLTFCEQN